MGVRLICGQPVVIGSTGSGSESLDDSQDSRIAGHG